MKFKKKPPLYSVWQSMKARCLNPRNKAFGGYGGRGITICERWVRSYEAFAEDMSPRPVGYSIDRIDNDKGYSPENCRWSDKKTQQRNQRRAVFVVVDGQKLRAIELAEQAGVKTDTIVRRAKAGLAIDAVLSKEPERNLSGLAVGGLANGARQRAKTHCPHGHSYDDAIISKEGFRRCRKCFYAREKRRLARRASQHS